MRIPHPALIMLLVITFGCDLYIWLQIRRHCKRRVWSWLYLLSSLICWVYLGVTLSTPRQSPDVDVTRVMWMLFSYVSVYLAKLAYTLFSLIGGLPRIWRSRPWPLGKWVGLPLGAIIFGVMWWGVVYTRHDIEVIEESVKIPSLPQSFDGYRIVQFSDAHVGTWGQDTTFVSQLVDSINAQKGDMIVFTGDIANRRTSEVEPFVKIFSRLHAPDGVWAVLGNHDYSDYMSGGWTGEEIGRDRMLLREKERQMGWKLLNNDHTFITRTTSQSTDSLVLIGVENWGDPPFSTYGALELAYPFSPDSVYNVNDRRCKILLSHNPEHWNRQVASHTNIDLTLSGHTHAMQTEVRLGKWRWSPGMWRYPQWGGMYKRTDARGHQSYLYVNIGCGEVAFPSRMISARPEITVITLHR